MKRLIVNADDFGLTPGVNRAVLEGHLHGIITSATLMANGAALELAIAMSLAQPTLGVGVHLNLTEGAPVARASDVPSLLRSDGLFLGNPGKLAKGVLTGKVKFGEIVFELRSQVEKIVRAGIRVTHLDSHKHVHVLPGVFDAAVLVACEFGIPALRCPVEPAAGGFTLFQSPVAGPLKRVKQYAVGRAVSGLAGWQKRKLARAGLCCAESFRGLSHTGFLNLPAVEKILRILPEGTTELLCHPGYVDAALLQTRTRLRGEREIELHALTSPEVRQLIGEQRIELIDYGDLAGGGPRADDAVWSQDGRPVQESTREACASIKGSADLRGIGRFECQEKTR